MKTLSEILTGLSEPIPGGWLKKKTMGGSQITFCPWYRVAHLMDVHAPGWQKEITNTIITATHIIHTVRVTITAAEGTFYREATGIEELKVKGYGDASSNAESMAFRRACANWGLGAHLYEKDDVSLEHGEDAPAPAKKKQAKASGDGQTGAPPQTWGQKIESAKAYLNKAGSSTEENWQKARRTMMEKTENWPEPHKQAVMDEAILIAIARGECEPAGPDVGDGLPY